MYVTLVVPVSKMIMSYSEFLVLLYILYRVIYKSLWDFRPLRYSSRDGHAKREHVNIGRDTPIFLSYLTVSRYVNP